MENKNNLITFDSLMDMYFDEFLDYIIDNHAYDYDIDDEIHEEVCFNPIYYYEYQEAITPDFLCCFEDYAAECGGIRTLCDLAYCLQRYHEESEEYLEDYNESLRNRLTQIFGYSEEFIDYIKEEYPDEFEYFEEKDNYID